MNIKKLLIIAAVCAASCQNFALGTCENFTDESLTTKVKDKARAASDAAAATARDASAAIHGKANNPASKAERKTRKAKDKLVRKAKKANDIVNDIAN